MNVVKKYDWLAQVAECLSVTPPEAGPPVAFENMQIVRHLNFDEFMDTLIFLNTTPEQLLPLEFLFCCELY